MIKDQPSQRGLWNRFHILSKKGEKRFSFLVPLTQVPKPKHTNFSSYEPGHPTSPSPEQAQAESTMERDKGEQLFLLYQLY